MKFSKMSAFIIIRLRLIVVSSTCCVCVFLAQFHRGRPFHSISTFRPAIIFRFLRLLRSFRFLRIRNFAYHIIISHLSHSPLHTRTFTASLHHARVSKRILAKRGEVNNRSEMRSPLVVELSGLVLRSVGMRRRGSVELDGTCGYRC